MSSIDIFTCALAVACGTLRVSVAAAPGSRLVEPTTFAMIDPAKVSEILWDEDDVWSSVPADFGVRDQVWAGAFPAWSAAHPRRRTYSTAATFRF